MYIYIYIYIYIQRERERENSAHTHYRKQRNETQHAKMQGKWSKAQNFGSEERKQSKSH